MHKLEETHLLSGQREGHAPFDLQALSLAHQREVLDTPISHCEGETDDKELLKDMRSIVQNRMMYTNELNTWGQARGHPELKASSHASIWNIKTGMVIDGEAMFVPHDVDLLTDSICYVVPDNLNDSGWLDQDAWLLRSERGSPFRRCSVYSCCRCGPFVVLYPNQ